MAATRSGVRLRQRAPGRGGARQEQLHRVARAAVAGRDAQARHREHPLERHQQPGAAGDQHRQPRAAREQPLEQHRHPVQQVLAVVQDQQRLPPREPAEHGVLGRTGLALAEAERGRDGGRDHGRIGDRHEIHVPGAVGVPPGHLGDHAQRQPGLADPARARPRSPGDASRVLRSAPPVRRPGRRTRSAARAAAGPLRARPDPPGRRVAAAAASARRSFTWSLRSSEDTWLSTVRTEMNSRAAISALVRCSPSAASTSASRADTPTPEATEPAPTLTLRLCPTPGRRPVPG